MTPIVLDCARLTLTRGYVWRRCRRCADLVALPHRVDTCNTCATRAGRRAIARTSTNQGAGRG